MNNPTSRPTSQPTSSPVRRPAYRLHLSTPSDHERERAEEAQKAEKRRKYWQNYKGRIKRVFGTLPPREHDDWKAEATANDRSLWDHLIAQARAYRDGVIVPTKRIEEQQQQLVAEMRRIGNNLNQLTRLAHIKAHQHGGLIAKPGDQVGKEVMRHLNRLEAKVALFDPLNTSTNSYETCDDH